ncbi:MAG TPA: hypothetical protein VMH81_22055 [Bryobacteraceae bacterium]|nr:hypothetical protein [Bryobacteraceae bacterium]
MSPPSFARALLFVVAGESWAECVAGDLEEEFGLICQSRNHFAGARWYVWQVVRSVVPLIWIRMRSGEFRQAALAALLGAAVPLVMLDRLWSFVYSQVPLKDGIGRAPSLLAVNVAAVCVGSAITGTAQSSGKAAWTTALALAAAAGIAVWASAGGAPVLYAVWVVAAAPASSLIAFRWRRNR